MGLKSQIPGIERLRLEIKSENIFELEILVYKSEMNSSKPAIAGSVGLGATHLQCKYLAVFIVRKFYKESRLF